MSVSEYFHSGIIHDLNQRGVISWQVFNRFDMYKTYQNFLIKEDHTESIKCAADLHQVSYRTIRRAIKTVEG